MGQIYEHENGKSPRLVFAIALIDQIFELVRYQPHPANNRIVSHTVSLRSSLGSAANLENVMTDIELRKIELTASNGMSKSGKSDSEKEMFIDSDDSKTPFDK